MATRNRVGRTSLPLNGTGQAKRAGKPALLKSRFEQLADLLGATPVQRKVMLALHHLHAAIDLCSALPDDYLVCNDDGAKLARDVLDTDAFQAIENHCHRMVDGIFEEGPNAAREVAHA